MVPSRTAIVSRARSESRFSSTDLGELGGRPSAFAKRVWDG